MSIDDMSTLERIHSAAKAEFTEKGYRSASIRSIVKAAGVTTGALYGYYVGKQELFSALVDEEYEYTLSEYKKRSTLLKSSRQSASPSRWVTPDVNA